MRLSRDDRHVRSRLGLLAGAALIALGVTVAVPPAGATTADPRIGALFFPSLLGVLPTLGGPHYCSAAVVHTQGHDVIATAAHCVYGSGAGVEFVPGFAGSGAPHGSWDVTAAYFDPSWVKGNNPLDDVAFLRVAPHHVAGKAVNVEDVTGAFALGLAPMAGHTVRVTGYPAGSGGTAVSCSAQVYDTAGYPSINCAGFVNGTSGGPWVHGSTLVGVIGGLHEGGCTPQVSYTAPFTAATASVLVRAAAGGHGQSALPPFSDGC
jgi:hypothetical protein